MKRLVLGSLLSCMLVGQVNSFFDGFIHAVDGSIRASVCGLFGFAICGPIGSGVAGAGLSYAAFSRIRDRRTYDSDSFKRRSGDFSEYPAHYPIKTYDRDVYDASRIVTGLGITAGSLKWISLLTKLRFPR